MRRKKHAHSSKERIGIESADYYSMVMSGSHIFFLRTMECILADLISQKEDIGYYAFLTEPFDNLLSLTDYMGIEETPFLRENFPLAGMNFLYNRVAGRRVEIKQGKRDLLCKIKMGDSNVYAGTLCVMMGADYNAKPQPSSLGFVIAPSQKEATQFLEAYYRAKREFNKAKGSVLDHRGLSIRDFRHMNWEDVILPDSMGQRIKDEIEVFFTGKAMYEEHGLDWRRGLLLAGSPGNGKTAICRAVATSAKVPVVYCQCDDGDLYGMIEAAQNTISQNAPCVAIFEDADTLGEHDGPRSALLNMLDGLFTCDGVFVIATTNSPDKLDTAFTGRPSRFDSYYVIPNPEFSEREQIFLRRLGKQAKNIPEKTLKSMLSGMDGLSAACVQEVAVCALLAALKKAKPVTADDLKDALGRIKEHLRASKDGLQKYTKGAIGFASPGKRFLEGYSVRPPQED